MTRKVHSHYRQAHLEGGGRCSETPAEVLDKEYDLIVMTASWDSRCLCLCDQDIRSTDGIGVFFSNRGTLGLRDQHDQRVTQFLEDHCQAMEVVEGESEDLRGLWEAMWVAAWKSYLAAGRPLDVLLDLSTCPRYYAMAFLAQGFRTGVVGRLTCFYAEGRYPPNPADANADQFTAGRWETRAVPGLTGTADPGNRRLYVVSVGFEGSKTFRAVSSDDPDRVAVLFPDPGVDPGYPERTQRENRLLFREYGIEDEDLIKAPAGDAITAWAALAEASVSRQDENPFYLCCGTKPHSLAMALHALVGERTTVLYAKPAGHKELEIVPSGVFWSYRIVDLTLPGARL